MFPDSKLLVPFDRVAIGKCTALWDDDAVSLPDRPAKMDEQNVGSWLNDIVRELTTTHQLAAAFPGRSYRSFDASTASKGPLGSFMVRKPDICVLDKADQFSVNKAAGPMHWRKIFAIVEVTAAKASQSVLKGILGQISEKAACIFDVQPQRRFTCALAFLGKPDDMEFIFVVVDRSSLIYTPAASLHSTQALSLLRIIFAFCFAVPETLGWIQQLCSTHLPRRPLTSRLPVTHATPLPSQHRHSKSSTLSIALRSYIVEEPEFGSFLMKTVASMS